MSIKDERPTFVNDRWSAHQVRMGLNTLKAMDTIGDWEWDADAKVYFIAIGDIGYLRLPHAQARELIRGHRLAMRAEADRKTLEADRLARERAGLPADWKENA